MNNIQINISNKLTHRELEAYRFLKTNIGFCGVKDKIKTLLITSCSSGEGKTTISINTAISMAESGMNVLYFDCDLRRSSAARLMGVKGKIDKGLTNLLAGDAELSDIIYATNIDGFHFIPSGPIPPNPSELLNTSTFKELLGILKNMFDIVIIDSPPLGVVIDAAIISTLADATILLIRVNKVTYIAAQRVKEQLEKAGARVIGSILNAVDLKDIHDYGYYSYSEDIVKKKRRSKSINIFRK